MPAWRHKIAGILQRTHQLACWVVSWMPSGALEVKRALFSNVKWRIAGLPAQTDQLVAIKQLEAIKDAYQAAPGNLRSRFQHLFLNVVNKSASRVKPDGAPGIHMLMLFPRYRAQTQPFYTPHEPVDAPTLHVLLLPCMGWKLHRPSGSCDESQLSACKQPKKTQLTFESVLQVWMSCNGGKRCSGLVARATPAICGLFWRWAPRTS